jgi:hypothetical protein
MSPKTKKATFNLHTDVLDELDKVMVQGDIRSKNALVEQALRRELSELRRQKRQSLWQEAAQDKLLIKDISEIEADFRAADDETAARIG